jgi:hypothetical protein
MAPYSMDIRTRVLRDADACRTRAPTICSGDLLQNVNLEIAIRDHLLQPGRVPCHRRRASRLGVRLRLRHVCERPDTEVSHGHRRVDARVSGHRCRRGIRSGRVIEVLTQLVSVHGAPRYFRRYYGPEFLATAILRWLADAGHRDGAHRSRQAVAECDARIVQRQVPGRVSHPRMVSEPHGREGRHRTLAAALQRGAAAFESRLSHAAGVLSHRSGH